VLQQAIDRLQEKATAMPVTGPVVARERSDNNGPNSE
jgi:hypothetical protein